MRTVNVGIIGLGTVGGGVARLILSHHDDYVANYGIALALARCLRPRTRRRRVPAASRDDAFTTDWARRRLRPVR